MFAGDRMLVETENVIGMAMWQMMDVICREQQEAEMNVHHGWRI